MPQILGLDVGKLRVGLAISDINQKKAEKLKVVPKSNYQAEREILDLINKFKIEILVVGLPLNSKQEETEQSQYVRNFIRRIEARTKVKIAYVDEYLSSETAKQNLGIKIDHKKIREAGIIDQEAARIILQTYLDSL